MTIPLGDLEDEDFQLQARRNGERPRRPPGVPHATTAHNRRLPARRQMWSRLDQAAPLRQVQQVLGRYQPKRRLGLPQEGPTLSPDPVRRSISG